MGCESLGTVRVLSTTKRYLVHRAAAGVEVEERDHAAIAIAKLPRTAADVCQGHSQAQAKPFRWCQREDVDKLTNPEQTIRLVTPGLDAVKREESDAVDGGSPNRLRALFRAGEICADHKAMEEAIHRDSGGTENTRSVRVNMGKAGPLYQPMCVHLP